MGDPRRIKSKYEGPSHPWESERLEEEKIIVKEYGLKNKKEIWKAQSKLKHFANQAKKLVNLTTVQAEKEKKQLLDKVCNLGILTKGSEMGAILSLNIRDMLNRRLQTIVFKKGLARTISQARQMITHGHILVNKKRMSIPSYMVLIDEEHSVSFITKSPFTDDMHPERFAEKATPGSKKKKMESKEEDKKEEKGKPKSADKKGAKKGTPKKEESKEEKPKADKKEDKQEEKKEESTDDKKESPKEKKKEDKKEDAKK